ncbi:ATP-binding protein [Streptomyces sp. SRF1]|uniref:ATP-binding protein n=1 Tax=Streptomyces sp. SRF1 TaxID=1549642 RepID=UPI0025B1F1C1|nr:ATP-binding protein [Streptomyces sp. SRF1]MDN3061310.1 ATP-binding protein [Streptomyces sp. SRF1]
MKLLLESPAQDASSLAMTRSVQGQFDMGLNLKTEHLAAVRGIVRAHLHLWGVGDETSERMLIAVNELLTNVCQHTGPDHNGLQMASLLVQRVPGGVTAIVSDRDARVPAQVVPAQLAENGRGWRIVKGLVDDVSVSVTGTGKDVWVYVGETT